MCEPMTSYPCSWSRHAATEESTPPDIATSTDSFAVIVGQATRVSFRRDRGPVRRSDGRRAELPARRARRRPRGDGPRRGRRRARGRRRGAAARAVGRRLRGLRGGPRPRSRAHRPPAHRRRPERRGPARLVRACSRDGRRRPCPIRPRTPRPAATAPPGRRRSTAPPTTTAIDRIRARIAAGDTYQVNHTLRLHATVRGDPRGLYRDLCHAQRGAYGAYLDTGRHRVLSASPELFFRIDGETISTKPMKGTAPRGRWLAEDLRTAGPPAGLGEGPRRERDDRGPAAQRHRPRGAGGVGDAGPTCSRPSGTRPCGS